MRRILWRVEHSVLLLLLLLVSMGFASAQSLFDRGLTSGPGAEPDHQVRTRLIADTTAIEPGRPFRLGVHFSIEPDWHIYWRYSGEVGLPTRVDFSLPEGFVAQELQWPNPHYIEDPATGLHSYGWEGELLLFATITPPEKLEEGAEYRFGAESDWLACKVECIPGKATDDLRLEVGEAIASNDAALFETFQKQAPVSPPDTELPVNVRIEPAEALLPTGSDLSQAVIAEIESPWGWISGDSDYETIFFPDATRDLETSFPLEADGSDPFQEGDATLHRSLAFEWNLKAYKDTPVGPVKLRPAMTLAAMNRETGETTAVRLMVDREIKVVSGETPGLPSGIAAGDEGASEASSSAEDHPSSTQFAFQVSGDTESRSALMILLFAFLGGMLLNVMPCVLPVLSIKVLGFVNQAKEDPARVLRSGLLFALGVYVSFFLLAAIVIAVKAAGTQIGWGFQLQEPRFVVLISAVIFAFGLSLFGVFTIELPGFAATGLQGTASRGGAAGDFMNGVLATVLATPCTAPLLGPALGYAFAQPPMLILAFFGVIASGLALPYVLLAARPGWLRFVPKPGPWMERFKQFMGVLLMATVVWLLSVLGAQTGNEGVTAALSFLVAVGVACWFAGMALDFGTSPARRSVLLLMAGGVAIGAYFGFPERSIRLLSEAGAEPLPVMSSGGDASEQEETGIDWKPFSIEAVNALVAENKTVFVDFTADWCLTCKVNERTVLSTDRVAEAFREYKVEALLADYTRRQPEITEILHQFGRAGVPMYVIFPAGRPEEYILLPEVLTPSLVIEKLAEASRPREVAASP